MSKDSVYQQLRSHLAYLNWQQQPKRCPPTLTKPTEVVSITPSSSRGCSGSRSSLTPADRLYVEIRNAKRTERAFGLLAVGCHKTSVAVQLLNRASALGGKLYRWLFPKRRQDTYSSVETLAMFSIWGIVSF